MFPALKKARSTYQIGEPQLIPRMVPSAKNSKHITTAATSPPHHQRHPALAATAANEGRTTARTGSNKDGNSIPPRRITARGNVSTCASRIGVTEPPFPLQGFGAARQKGDRPPQTCLTPRPTTGQAARMYVPQRRWREANQKQQSTKSQTEKIAGTAVGLCCWVRRKPPL